MKLIAPFILSLWLSIACCAKVPQTVAETWSEFDPEAEALEIELVRESINHGIVLRQVRYLVGTFGKRKARVAAFYAFPENEKALPGIVQLHGGGQRARAEEVRFWASQGYAAIAVNWGEHVIGEERDPNTDWAGIPAGFSDPEHHNDVSPGEGTLHPVAHPWNSSWILYSAAARRAITLLDRQPEVDGSRIGVTGHSMGGRLTVLTAIDPRVTAASPSVGGSGFLYSDIAGVPGSRRRMRVDLDLYNATLDCSNYWPLVRCPVMFLGATNDFNSPMEFVVRGFRRLPDKDRSRMSFTPHMNHRFKADNVAARVRWFETHLKRSFVFPKTARATLKLDSPDGIPQFAVEPDLSSPHKLGSVDVFYGYDRDPRARFWRSAEVKSDGKTYVAECPVMDLGEPLFVFANVTYDTGEEIVLPRGNSPTPLLTITSECRSAFPAELAKAGVKPRGERQRLIEDFHHGWRDWSLVGANHRAHWNYETHKINDPMFVGPLGASLALEVEVSSPGDTMAVILESDRWRGYTGRKHRRYAALVKLDTAGRHSIDLPIGRFSSPQGETLRSYDFLTSLILTPGQKERPDQVPRAWRGKVPNVKNIRWVGGEFARRPRPYLGPGASEVDADAAFNEQFERAVDESVRREAEIDAR